MSDVERRHFRRFEWSELPLPRTALLFATSRVTAMENPQHTLYKIARVAYRGDHPVIGNYQL